MEEEFAALADPRFYTQALKELKSAFPTAKLKRIAQDSANSIILLSCEDCGYKHGTAYMFSYVYEIFPVFTFVKDIDAEYYTVIENVLDIISVLGAKSFRIEVKKIDYKSKERAKDLEVKMGREIESRGPVADLKNPKLLINVVLTSSGAIIGSQDVPKIVGLDAFRYFNKLDAEHINRSEFKLIEAIEHFGVEIKKGERCIDVGSAPGGWTHFLLSNGAKVLAIDSALMDYDAMPPQSSILIVMQDPSKSKPFLKAENRKIELKSVKEFEEYAKKSNPFNYYDLVHVASNITSTSLLSLDGLGKFGILAIDINRGPEEAAAVAASLCTLLDPGARIIMTIKMPESKPEHYVEEARRALSGLTTEVKFAKLRHNRQELTAFAIFNASRGEPNL